jgi:hypothetical protein
LAHGLLAGFIFEIACSQSSAAIEKVAVHEDAGEEMKHGIKRIAFRGAALFFKQSSPPTHSHSRYHAYPPPPPPCPNRLQSKLPAAAAGEDCSPLPISHHHRHAWLAKNYVATAKSKKVEKPEGFKKAEEKTENWFQMGNRTGVASCRVK